MRIISRKTLIAFWEKYPKSEHALKAWYDEAASVVWKTPNELKEQYRNASIISNKRVIFNIKGNDFRLVVDIEYRIGIAFIVWVGTHKEYDKVNILELKYE